MINTFSRSVFCLENAINRSFISRVRALLSFLILATVLVGNSLFALELAQDDSKPMLKTANHDSGFVILMYHHVSDETPRSTSVTPAELEQHLAYLSEFHTVVSLQSALNAIENKTTLPEKAVVITFDDGYRNILENAHALIRKYGFEYTIFINPSQIDTSNSQLTWGDVKKMSKEGVTFANHTLDHLHLLDRRPDEDKSAWLNRIEQNIDEAESELSEKLGYSKKWLAYPFGEFDIDVKAMLKKKGYLGFGQHSGAVGQLSDLQSIPRFPAAGNYANLETLKTKLNSLSMPVTEVRPDRYVMQKGEVLGEVQIDVLMDDIQFSRIACYFRGETLALNETKTGFSMPIERPFTTGRTRVNCTAPSNKQSDRFYWYSIPFFTAKDDGTYLD